MPETNTLAPPGPTSTVAPTASFLTVPLNVDAAGFHPLSLAFDGTNVWVGGRDRDLAVKVRTSDGAVLQVVPLAKWGAGVPDMAFDGVNVWALVNDTIVQVRASDGQLLGTCPAGQGASSLVFDGTSLWVANAIDGTLIKW